MSYCRWSDNCDWYVYWSTGGYISADNGAGEHRLKTVAEAIHFLAGRVLAGDDVPRRAFDQLLNDWELFGNRRCADIPEAELKEAWTRELATR